MADPKGLTRDELAKFLPSQRAIRAFEELFKLIPSDLDAVLIFAESSLLAAQNVRNEVTQLRQDLLRVQIEAQLPKQVNLSVILARLDALEAQILTLRSPNLDQIIKRLEFLETLEG